MCVSVEFFAQCVVSAQQAYGLLELHKASWFQPLLSLVLIVCNDKLPYDCTSDPVAASDVTEITVGCSQTGYVLTGPLLEAASCNKLLMARVLKTFSNSAWKLSS